jgi:hypothetical protein
MTDKVDSSLGATRFLKRWAVAARNGARASAGYLTFRRSGVEPEQGVRGLRGLFTAHPELPRTISRFTTSTHRPRLQLPAHGALGTIDAQRLHRVVRALRTDGYYVFPDRLSEELLEQLDHLFDTLPRYASLDNWSTTRVAYDPANVVSGRYLCEQAELVDAPIVQRLFSDPSIITVADAYLHCDSFQTDVGMWESVVAAAETRSASSQLFHSDRDHLQFVKFFVYLNHVDSGTGPHVYVRGSHHRRPEVLRRDIRFEDSVIAAQYSPDDIIEVLGPRGTIIAADTSGIHKGKAPAHGTRRIFELEYASSCYGPGALPMVLHEVSPELAEGMAATPRKFSRFDVAGNASTYRV